MRLTSSQVWSVVGFAALVWFALGLLDASPPNTSPSGNGGGLGALFSLADIIPALLFAGSIHERWLWRHSLFHRFRIIATPVVIGTWRGELESLWIDPATQQRPAVKTVYLTIRQTATTISVRLLTNESASEQVAGTVTKSDSGYPAIAYNYRNRPELQYREGGVSPIHYGGAIIEILGDPATGLSGEYWTDRSSRGQLKFREQASAIAQTFEDAEKLTFSTPRPVGVLSGAKALFR